MRAVQITKLDGPGAVEVVDLPDVKASETQYLIEVHAAGVTFPDLLLTRGAYQMKPSLPFVPGSEIAGVVRAAPSGGALAVGARVAAFPGIGGFQELVATGPESVFPLPGALSFAAGAALPVTPYLDGW